MQLTTTLAILGLPGGWEWIIILLIGLVLFGRRLPEVGRSLGKSIVEFKKGIKDIEGDIDDASDNPRQIAQPSTGHIEAPADAATPQAEAAPRTVSKDDRIEGTQPS